ncbi:VCBS repeat-containing protein [uncultured Thiodictyon sp.]|uniref:FG-GAP repeat domain-containing protein n=1 Tax=uncultured Thiodictyon sp. TaxID=1846217 RepID=UPI0025DA4202|nr:VCBS repeat-containing protein [uncultured Thiodictyon sp.]
MATATGATVSYVQKSGGGLAVTGAPRSASLGQLNPFTDNFLDLVLPNSGTSIVTVRYGGGNGTFSATPIPFILNGNVGANPYYAAIGQVNTTGTGNDTYFDIVTANHGSHNISVLLANGNNGDFNTAVEYDAGAGTFPTSVALGDFNRDGQTDIVTANSSSNSVSVFLGVLNGNGTFPATGTLLLTNGNAQWVAVSDVNVDGNPDIVVANGVTKNVAVLLGNGCGDFAAAVNYSTGTSTPTSIATADFNLDGFPDIVVSDATANSKSVFIFLNNGNGVGGKGTFDTVGKFQFSFPNLSTTSVVAGDINNDGIPDIVAGQSTGGTQPLLGTGDGINFNIASPSTGTASDTYAAVGDLDNDYKPDVVSVGPTLVNPGINISSLYVSFLGNLMYINPPSRSTDNNFGSPTWGDTTRYVIQYNYSPSTPPNNTPYLPFWGQWAARWPVTRTAPYDHLIADMKVAQTIAGCQNGAAGSPPGYGGSVIASISPAPALPAGSTVCSRPAPLLEQTTGVTYDYRIWAIGKGGTNNAAWSASVATPFTQQP